MDIATSITTSSNSWTLNRPSSVELNGLESMSLTYLMRMWQISASLNLSNISTLIAQASRFFIAKIPLSLIKLTQRYKKNKPQDNENQKRVSCMFLKKSVLHILLMLLRHICKVNTISMEPRVRMTRFFPDYRQVPYLKRRHNCNTCNNYGYMEKTAKDNHNVFANVLLLLMNSSRTAFSIGEPPP